MAPCLGLRLVVLVAAAHLPTTVVATGSRSAVHLAVHHADTPALVAPPDAAAAVALDARAWDAAAFLGRAEGEALAAAKAARADVQKPLQEVTIRIPLRRLIITLAVWVLLTTICACAYRNGQELNVEDALSGADEELSAEGEIRHGHFHCLTDVNVCIMATFCTPVRWAASMSNAGILTFWVAFTFFVMLVVLNTLMGGMTFFVLVLVCMYYRTRVRSVVTSTSSNVKEHLQDCIMWWCCCCCAVAQEARSVDKAKLENLPGMPQNPVPEM